jgi:hypothetical protein
MLYFVLFVFPADFCVFGMRANPADEQVDLLLSKIVFCNHPIFVTTDVENDPVTVVAQ